MCEDKLAGALLLLRSSGDAGIAPAIEALEELRAAGLNALDPHLDSIYRRLEAKYGTETTSFFENIKTPSIVARRYLATLYYRQHLWTRAIEHCDAVLEACPDDRQIRAIRGTASLGLGDYASGWRDQEYRRVCFEFPVAKRWQGADVHDKHLLIHFEGGAGDSIHFARFIPDIAERSARLSVYERPEIRPLFRMAFQNTGIDVCDTPPWDADYTLPIFSCCRFLDLRPADYTRQRYLRAPGSSHWRQRLRSLPQPRIGIVWAGGSGNPEDATRSMPRPSIDTLLRLPVGWVSLQVGRGPETEIYDAAPYLSDWAETAAIIDALDLVISVDTAVAHLAGALGKPIWLMNRFDSCWRWGTDSLTSLWYPTMRIFRQPTSGDWAAVIDEIVSALMAR